MTPITPVELACGALNFPAEAVLSRFQRKELARGDCWVRPGEIARSLSFLESGLLRHYRTTKDGEKVITAVSFRLVMELRLQRMKRRSLPFLRRLCAKRGSVEVIIGFNADNDKCTKKIPTQST